MAGDWIKIEHALPNKPEVMAIADALDISEMEVVGHLVCFWTWVDQNLSDKCPVVSGTFRGLNRVAGRTGFAEAMVAVGWLEIVDGMVKIPNYDDHLSQSAKSRSVEAKRKRTARKKNGQEADNCPGQTRTKSGQNTGPEKRREEYITPPYPPAGGESAEVDLAEARRIRSALHPADSEAWEKLTSACNSTISEIVSELGGWGKARVLPDKDFSREFTARWKLKHPGRKRDRERKANQ